MHVTYATVDGCRWNRFDISLNTTSDCFYNSVIYCNLQIAMSLRLHLMYVDELPRISSVQEAPR